MTKRKVLTTKDRSRIAKKAWARKRARAKFYSAFGCREDLVNLIYDIAPSPSLKAMG